MKKNYLKTIALLMATTTVLCGCGDKNIETVDGAKLK